MSSVSDVSGIGAHVTLRPSFRSGKIKSASRNRQPTRRGLTQQWRSEQGNSLRCPVRSEELFHRGRDFDYVRLEREMPGIQELNPRVRYVLSKCLGPRGNEEGVVLTPNRQQRRLGLPKVILKCRIELHVRRVIEKQIQLNVFVPRTLQQSRVQRVRFRRNTLRIATPCVYCQRVPSSVRMFLRITSRFSGVGSAQYFRIGPQASPSPSS